MERRWAFLLLLAALLISGCLVGNQGNSADLQDKKDVLSQRRGVVIAKGAQLSQKIDEMNSLVAGKDYEAARARLGEARAMLKDVKSAYLDYCIAIDSAKPYIEDGQITLPAQSSYGQAKNACAVNPIIFDYCYPLLLNDFGEVINMTERVGSLAAIDNETQEQCSSVNRETVGALNICNQIVYAYQISEMNLFRYSPIDCS